MSDQDKRRALARSLDDKMQPPGTVLLGSVDRRAYLYVCQTSERMEHERAVARSAGVQDPIDFLLVLDGQRYAVSFAQLLAALRTTDQPTAIPCPHPDVAIIDGGLCACCGQRVTDQQASQPSVMDGPCDKCGGTGYYVAPRPADNGSAG